MNNYFKYLLIICLFCFSVYYTKRINELSLSNNEIMVSINEYASIPSMEGLLTMLAGGMIEHVKNLSIGLNLYAEKLGEEN